MVVLVHTTLSKLITLIVIATRSAGGVGSPYNQLYPVNYRFSSTNYGSEDNLVWNKPLITLRQSDIARYFTLRLYFHSAFGS